MPECLRAALVFSTAGAGAAIWLLKAGISFVTFPALPRVGLLVVGFCIAWREKWLRVLDIDRFVAVASARLLGNIRKLSDNTISSTLVNGNQKAVYITGR